MYAILKISSENDIIYNSLGYLYYVLNIRLNFRAFSLLFLVSDVMAVIWKYESVSGKYVGMSADTNYAACMIL